MGCSTRYILPGLHQQPSVREAESAFTQDTCFFVSQSGWEMGWGQNLDRPPCAAPSTRSHSPALWFWPDRTPLTCSCPEGRLNRGSSLQTKLWTFSSLCVGCLWRSKCLQHDTTYYRVLWTVFDNWTLTGPFTFRLHSNSIIQAVLPGPSQSCHPLCRLRLSPNTFVCLTCSEVKQIQMSRVWSRGSLQGHARRQLAHASKTLNSSNGFCKTLKG